jgi:hypothetical protein
MISVTKNQFFFREPAGDLRVISLSFWGEDITGDLHVYIYAIIYRVKSLLQNSKVKTDNIYGWLTTASVL